MTDLDENYVPYAPPSSVITVLRQLRNAALPDILDNQSIERIGVSKGNAGRTVAAMKYIGVIDGEGKKTEIQDRLARASTEEYPNVLAEVLRNAYSKVFKRVDPAEASDIQLRDAFRGFDPAKQRGRMVSLFIGLCQEANIIAGEPTVVQRRTTTTSSRTKNNSNGKPKNENRNGEAQQTELPAFSGTPSGEQPSNLMRFNIDGRYKRLIFLHEDLPKDGKWTAEERENWIGLYTFYLDYLVKVVEEDEINSQ